MTNNKPLLLVVDDIPDNLKLLRGLLAKSYRLTFATSGAEALERVKSAQPNLILLDLMMPEMDGIEVCQRLKSSYETANIPIIFLTANHEVTQLVEAFEAGAADYVTKPFQTPELLARIKTHLQLIQLQEELRETVKQLEAANQELTELSQKDGLTKIANRRYFDHYLQQKWEQLRREEKPLSVILIDLDYFKQYNDYYGHLQGDECLKTVAQTLSQVIKRSTDLVARYGGEEFVLVLPDTDEAGAVAIAEEIQSAIAQQKISHASHLASDQVTVSLGIATVIPTVETSWETLVTLADVALYQAKEQGRDRSCCLESEIGKLTTEDRVY